MTPNQARGPSAQPAGLSNPRVNGQTIHSKRRLSAQDFRQGVIGRLIPQGPRAIVPPILQGHRASGPAILQGPRVNGQDTLQGAIAKARLMLPVESKPDTRKMPARSRGGDVLAGRQILKARRNGATHPLRSALAPTAGQATGHFQKQRLPSGSALLRQFRRRSHNPTPNHSFI